MHDATVYGAHADLADEIASFLRRPQMRADYTPVAVVSRFEAARAHAVASAVMRAPGARQRFFSVVHMSRTGERERAHEARAAPATLPWDGVWRLVRHLTGDAFYANAMSRRERASHCRRALVVLERPSVGRMCEIACALRGTQSAVLATYSDADVEGLGDFSLLNEIAWWHD